MLLPGARRTRLRILPKSGDAHCRLRRWEAGGGGRFGGYTEKRLEQYLALCTNRAGTLYAEAKIVHLHRKLATFEVSVTNEKEELIALFTATAYRKDIPLNFEK